jgi:hypothetical protein
MIINHPVLNRFSPSIREIIPETDDDKIIIPNTFALVGLPPEPTYPQNATGQIAESSHFLNTFLQVNNGSGNTQQNQTITILRNGYWNVNLHLEYISNFLDLASVHSFQIRLTPLLGFSTVILGIFGNIGVQNLVREFEVMIQTPSTIDCILAANGVGNDHKVSVSTFFNKLL